LSQLELNEPNAIERITYFTDVILPIPVPKLFTYRVPFELNENIGIGLRVIVPFGQRKVLTGVIAKVHKMPPKDYEAKYILDILDLDPSINSTQINFFEWMASYYMCTVGEVLNIALPSGLKISSESRVQLHPAFDLVYSGYPLSDNETTIIEILEERESLSYNEISEITGLKTIYSLIKSLVRKECIIIYEEIKEKYKPKIEKRVRLKPEIALNNQKIHELLDDLSTRPKQVDAIMYYLQQVPVFDNPGLNENGMSKSAFLKKEISVSSVSTLVKNNIFDEFEKIISRFPEIKPEVDAPVLSKSQQIAKEKIHIGFDQNKPVLLHGVTGSGKTEIYIDLIQDVVESGHQALYLLPEIALTTQIVSRLRKVFGDKMGVYHSRFSDNERVEVWKGVLNGSFTFVVGVRSSLFLPFDNLGLVIIDEEHETSYKQMDPAPRYHARDASLVLARLHHAKVLLGSATPSIETNYNTISGSFDHVELKERYGEASLPDIEFADIGKERKQKKMKGDFSSKLVEEIEKTLNNEEQVIIFQNRRGYAPYLNCETCGWIPKCENCSVSLTYHLYKNELRCHYCGFRQHIPSTCNSCGSMELETKSFGTEKLEEDLKLMFPEHRVKRMDLDTTRKKYGYQTIIEEFESGTIDILVGTQMVSKGLDFNKVALVGIFDADRMLHFPDFRAHERTFQLITQVSGRAGRRKKKGKVIIQTYSPEDIILKMIQEHNYEGFYQKEIQERKHYKYSPFYRLINITLKHKDSRACREACEYLSGSLKEIFGNSRILGPHEGLIAKIRNQYIWEILVKLERGGVDLPKAKEILKNRVFEMKQQKEFRNIHLIFDVDPY
jgi:primosomal protein N' (replication factor Y)